jgi:copper ion binding protein
MEQITLTAPDISCEHCQRAIEREIGALPGVASVSVDIPTKHVSVTYDPDAVTRDRIVEALDEEGYPVSS